MPTGFDLDNVLAASGEKALELINLKFGTQYTLDQCDSYYLELLPGMTEEMKAFVRQMFVEPRFFKAVRPMEGSIEGTQRVAEVDEVFYITAREDACYEATLWWLETWRYPVGDIVCTKDKVQACRDLGIQAYVEDDAKWAIRIATELDIPVYLFDYRWNRRVSYPMIVRLPEHWADLIRLLDRMSDDEEG